MIATFRGTCKQWYDCHVQGNGGETGSRCGDMEIGRRQGEGDRETCDQGRQRDIDTGRQGNRATFTGRQRGRETKKQGDRRIDTGDRQGDVRQ